ncbi:MAG: hypothetical protein ACLFP4_14000 [Spirochaetales bacterium]
MSTIDDTAVKLECGAPHNAFLEAHPVRIKVSVPQKLSSERLRFTITDLALDKTAELPVGGLDVWPDKDRGPDAYTVSPKVGPGVYRLEVHASESGAPTTVAALTFATAPGTPARELPDDWPIAIHFHDRLDHPIPGFKWHRYFADWSYANPARGEFRWEMIDHAFAAVKSVGGKVELADDGAPVWTSGRGKVQMDWRPEATAYPPDDLDTLREYLTELRERYDDGSGTLGALETWNEANTFQRYQGSYGQLVEMAKVFREVADGASQSIEIVGLAVSAGHHSAFVDDVVVAGILDHVDAISGHFYEEMHSYELECPINSLPRHARLLTAPVRRLERSVAVHNSECGISFVGREAGRILTQQEVEDRYASGEQNPDFPWIVDGKWRNVSEFRAAAEYVAGIVMLLAHGVTRTYAYTHYGWLVDGAPSLPWVAVMVLGKHLRGVDYHKVREVDARVLEQPPTRSGAIKALAYRLGSEDGPAVTVVWTFESDTRHGRSKLWQRWLDPVPVEVALPASAAAATLCDMYDRTASEREAADGYVSVEVGEEPLYLIEGTRQT